MKTIQSTARNIYSLHSEPATSPYEVTPDQRIFINIVSNMEAIPKTPSCIQELSRNSGKNGCKFGSTILQRKKRSMSYTDIRSISTKVLTTW